MRFRRSFKLQHTVWFEVEAVDVWARDGSEHVFGLPVYGRRVVRRSGMYRRVASRQWWATHAALLLAVAALLCLWTCAASPRAAAVPGPSTLRRGTALAAAIVTWAALRAGWKAVRLEFELCVAHSPHAAGPRAALPGPSIARVLVLASALWALVVAALLTPSAQPLPRFTPLCATSPHTSAHDLFPDIHKSHPYELLVSELHRQRRRAIRFPHRTTHAAIM
eukprot:Selendium_serpulae@DN9465_c0_g1_i1.p1